MAFDRKAYMAEYNKNWKEKNKDYWAKRYIEKKDKIIAQCKEWSKNNKGARNAITKRYHTTKINRTVAWADHEEINNLYKFAQYMEWLTMGIKYHVDHIIPLQGKTVCGLHTHDNLQILRASDNLRKGNKLNA